MAIRKLKLDLDAVRVETFTSESVLATRGTAVGYGSPSGQFGPECISRWPNCNLDWSYSCLFC